GECRVNRQKKTKHSGRNTRPKRWPGACPGIRRRKAILDTRAKTMTLVFESNREALPPFLGGWPFLRKCFGNRQGPALMCPLQPTRRAGARRRCCTCPWVSSGPGSQLPKHVSRCSEYPSPPCSHPQGERRPEIRTRSQGGAANVVLCADD